MIKILLVDDHELFRESIKKMISLEDDMKVVGECSNGTEVLEAVEKHSPEIVVMDINMPWMNGVEASLQLHEERPDVKVIILSIHDDENYVFQTLRSGTSGYLLKDMEGYQLIDAIRTVNKGEIYVHPRVTGRLVDEFRRLTQQEISQKRNAMLRQVLSQESFGKQSSEWFSVLSEREYEVLRLMAAGLSNRSIGERLFISEKTVKNHVSHILEKMKVQDRTQAVVLAIKYGWIEA